MYVVPGCIYMLRVKKQEKESNCRKMRLIRYIVCNRQPPIPCRGTNKSPTFPHFSSLFLTFLSGKQRIKINYLFHFPFYKRSKYSKKFSPYPSIKCHTLPIYNTVYCEQRIYGTHSLTLQPKTYVNFYANFGCLDV